MRYLVALLCFVVFFSGSASAEEQGQPVPLRRSFSPDQLAKLGQAMYRQDVLASRATDMLLRARPEAASMPIRGWITEEGGPEAVVLFFAQQGDAFRIIFEVCPGKREVAVVADGGRAPDKAELERFMARQKALENITEACSDRYNSIILPDPERDGWLVYWLAATTDPNKVLTGGHYRFSVAKDGTLTDADKLFAACTAFERPELAEGQESVGLFTTHTVSPTPLETHVFLSLQHNLDIAVRTPEGLWLVSEGEIARIDEEERAARE